MSGESARVVRYDIWPGVGIGGPDHEFVVQDSGEWVKYDDHESALAEQRDAYERAIADWIAMGQATEAKLATLISGLEALADDLESMGVKGGSSWSAAQRIRTLASAGLEGNGTTNPPEISSKLVTAKDCS